MSGMPWFRMYTDFLDDPKIIDMGFDDQRHFVFILALKADGVLDQNCEIRLLDRIVAQRLWVDFGIISGIKDRLFKAGLIDKNWQPIAWEKRQKSSDSSKDRVRKFRENNKKQEVEDCNGDVTLQGRYSNGLEEDKIREDKIREDIDNKDSGYINTVSQNENQIPEKRKKSPSRKTQLPETWILRKDQGEWAMQERPDLTPDDIRRLAEQFKDHWIGNGETKAKWDSVWRNWVRNDKKFARGNNHAKIKQFDPVADAIEEERQRAKQDREREGLSNGQSNYDPFQDSVRGNVYEHH